MAVPNDARTDWQDADVLSLHHAVLFTSILSCAFIRLKVSNFTPTFALRPARRLPARQWCQCEMIPINARRDCAFDREQPHSSRS